MAKKNKYSTRIKYTCDKCKYVKPYTKRESRNISIRSQITSVMFLLGILFIVLFSFVGFAQMGDTIVSAYMTKNANLDTDYMRNYVINSTSGCDNDGYRTSSYCYAFTLFKHLEDVRYVPQGFFKVLQDEQDTFLYGGDCKHQSMLYVAMMKSVGFDARVICKNSEEHCVAIVANENYYEKSYGYAVVDLTIPGFYVMDKYSDLWDYQEIGVRYE